MRSRLRWLIVLASVLALTTAGLPAQADHKTRPDTRNIHALGHSPQPASFAAPSGQQVVNSDIAFWGNIAFNGNYDGFRVIDISSPGNPKEISHPRCNGDQGDIVVWDDILVRSWNSAAPAGRFCDGEPVPVGFEGLHIFDISDLSDPELVGEVELSARPQADAFGCGSHTATAVPDLENNRLLIYNATSGGPCPFVSIIEVPLDDPGSASFLRNEPLIEADAAHDNGVILGDVNLLVSASHSHANVFDIGENQHPGGSLEDPEFLFHITEPGVGVGGNWHSAALTWDGEVIVMGWEPGGGTQAECEATDPDVKKSAFFYDADTGAKLGQWTLPRPQGRDENCTIHNYNVVPTRSGRYVLVSGNYQAGTWVTDFTDPANPVTVAWSDPPSLGPGPFCSQTTPPGCQLGGAWSTYWYNGFMYESDITKGLNVFRLSDKVTGGAIKLPHLNPQTQEFSQ
jgi:LVIVD repeat